MGNFNVSGALASLATLKKRFPDRAGAALYGEAQIETTECKKRCPVWNTQRDVPLGAVPGALRASIHVEGPFREGRRIWCLIVAGGPAAPYALLVHEDLEAHHQVGEAKFIERTLHESAPHMPGRLVARINEDK